MAQVARRIPVQSVAAALWLALLAPAAFAQEPAGSILVRYSFDDGVTDTGPDTFRVFENSRGSVSLSHAYRWSGDSSVEIRDVAGDRDFPELQGYFPAISSGTLYAHFAILTTTPEEEFNVALAGPQGFRLARNGIAFWLHAREGFLFHYSDSIPKRLFRLEPFTWYFVDVTYRIGEGAYDLLVRKEGDSAPRVSLAGQANAANQPGSIVDKFSFVGDVEDDVSQVLYYVDDVVIGTDRGIPVLPFVAPGRRRLFVESLADAQSLLRGRPSCLPVSNPADLGFEAFDLRAVKEAGLNDLLHALSSGQALPWRLRSEKLGGRLKDLLGGVGEWAEGCAALRAGEPAAALGHFQEAASKSPGRMYPVSAALALASLGQFQDADELLAASRSRWSGDPRYALALAIVGGARGDLGKAEAALRETAEVAYRETAEAKRCRRLEEAMAAEQYFSALLLNGFYDLAAQYADRVIDRLSKKSAPVAAWLERRADAAFFAGDWTTARKLYEQCAGDSTGALLKLSDLAFKMGDLAEEKRLRERIYGSLKAHGPEANQASGR